MVPQTSCESCGLENAPSSLTSSLGRGGNSSPACTLSSGFAYSLWIAGMDGGLDTKFGSDTSALSCKLTDSCISKCARKPRMESLKQTKQPKADPSTWALLSEVCTCGLRSYVRAMGLTSGHLIIHWHKTPEPIKLQYRGLLMCPASRPGGTISPHGVTQ